ncbi:MAG: FKBP-type peptidyl-prolyl cis-trans isomerase [Gemmatimonadota bacterium]|nr:FKBP-type peptidyl-prolyl cis-trans isomerase [Gemmatimonadota bacterium]
MSDRFRPFVLPALLTVAACLPDATLETDAQKASYGIGLNIGRSLADIEEHVDMVAVMQGVTDALAEAEPALTRTEIETAMAAFEEMIRAEARERGSTEGAAFLEENAAREGVIVTESGLQYELLREGDGASPVSGGRAVVHYRGMLPDGTEFDSSYGDGEAVKFDVDGVVPGFSEALKLMKVGGHIRVVIPSDLAYGESGRLPVIGPNQVLVYEIELLGIE